MPEPIIALQRRLSLVGAIRAGGEKPPRGVGAKLDAFRLTSPRRELLDQAAKLYGGEVTPWQSPVGQEWQVYTQHEELPVLVMPATRCGRATSYGRARPSAPACATG
jgi:hypothetical protein